MAAIEPQSAAEYDDRTTVAVRSVLIEIGQTLGSYAGKVAVIGGAVPWLLRPKVADMQHVGTIDVDLSLDAEALGDGEYAQIVESLQRQGYRQRGDLRRFQLVRTVPSRDDGPDINVVVDFLMPRDAKIKKNAVPLISGFVDATRALLDVEAARSGYSLIAGKFRGPTDFGPVSVRRFVEGSPALGGRTADLWQQDAFGQVDAWLTELDLG